MPECFKPRTIKLDRPIERTGELLMYVDVPCGKCANCIKRRRMEWCFRMEEELRVSKNAYFLTLTYDRDNVPYDKYGNMVLVKTTLDSKKFARQRARLPEVKDKYLRKMKLKELNWFDDSGQGFIKRLRSIAKRDKDVKREHFLHGLNKNDKLVFFLVGEYGERFGRPHFHAIVYNCCIAHVKDAWPFGEVHYKPATSEMIAYCTKYMDKWKDKKQDWRKPSEFNLQSQGIGISFVERMMNFYKANLDVNFLINRNGVKVPLPRYYRYKMLNEQEIDEQILYISGELKRLKDDEIRKVGESFYYQKKSRIKKRIDQDFKRSRKSRDID